MAIVLAAIAVALSATAMGVLILKLGGLTPYDVQDNLDVTVKRIDQTVYSIRDQMLRRITAIEVDMAKLGQAVSVAMQRKEASSADARLNTLESRVAHVIDVELRRVEDLAKEAVRRKNKPVSIKSFKATPERKPLPVEVELTEEAHKTAAAIQEQKDKHVVTRDW